MTSRDTLTGGRPSRMTVDKIDFMGIDFVGIDHVRVDLAKGCLEYTSGGH